MIKGNLGPREATGVDRQPAAWPPSWSHSGRRVPWAGRGHSEACGPRPHVPVSRVVLPGPGSSWPTCQCCSCHTGVTSLPPGPHPDSLVAVSFSSFLIPWCLHLTSAPAPPAHCARTAGRHSPGAQGPLSLGIYPRWGSQGRKAKAAPSLPPPGSLPGLQPPADLCRVSAASLSGRLQL